MRRDSSSSDKIRLTWSLIDHLIYIASHPIRVKTSHFGLRSEPFTLHSFHRVNPQISNEIVIILRVELDSNIEVRKLDSNEVTRHVNQMESHLTHVEISHLDIRVEQRHVTPLVE